MGTVMDDVRIPAPEDFTVAWIGFFLTVSAVATCRSNDFGPPRFGMLARRVTEMICAATDNAETDAFSDITDMLDDERQRVSLGILYEELIYFTWMYRAAFEAAGMATPSAVTEINVPEELTGEQGSPYSQQAVDDAVTIIGSIPKLMDKLPSWLRKAIDVLLEALKLTRGMVD